MTTICASEQVLESSKDRKDKKNKREERLEAQEHLIKEEKKEKNQLPSTHARWELREMLNRGLSIEENYPKEEEE